MLKKYNILVVLNFQGTQEIAWMPIVSITFKDSDSVGLKKRNMQFDNADQGTTEEHSIF